ncbi:MAG: hypothetical protein ACUVWB_10055 [Anaerolineae bacterium]
MRSVWHALVTFVSTAAGAMLGLWLTFGTQRAVCGETVTSMFVAGAPWFAGLALFWAIMLAGLRLFQLPLLPFYLILSFVLGSIFHSIHQGVLHLWDGVNLSLSALAAILISQYVVLSFLYRRRLEPQQFGLALQSAAVLTGAGLAGVVITDLLLGAVPCQPIPAYRAQWEYFARLSPVWFSIWGIIPSLVSAWLYAGEKKLSQS